MKKLCTSSALAHEKCPQTRSRLGGAIFLSLFLIVSSLFISPPPAHALLKEELTGPMNNFQYGYGTIDPNCDLTGIDDGVVVKNGRGFGPTYFAAIPALMITGIQSQDGTPCTEVSLLPQTGKFVSMLFNNQVSSQEYIADLMDNVGLPTVSRAYAQGTGYGAMAPFLPFWKAFRNLAYSLYIIMFVVVGIMIMLRTKVNAQTIITIQTALPNLLITLLLITFSYAIVGFMIDLMYFLIYFLVFLLSSPGIDIISTPTKAISRLMGGSAWNVIFEGRNSVIWAIAASINSLLSGVGGVLKVVGKAGAIFSLTYLLAAVWLGVTMIKLLFTLVKAYVMLIVQTVTAPVQLLMNAMPGSKAFSEWLKKTASYLLPFPVVGAMFIMAAIFVGDPSRALLFKGTTLGDPNPFGINTNSEFYTAIGTDGKVWLPPFTLTSGNLQGNDIMALIGFFIFTMTPAAAKMAMDWLQVKESPYTSEIGAGLSGAWGLAQGPIGIGRGIKQQAEQRTLMRDQATWIGNAVGTNKTQEPVPK